MSTSSIEALGSAWARIAEEAEFPADYEGTASPEAHRASEAIQERIREHIVATNLNISRFFQKNNIKLLEPFWTVLSFPPLFTLPSVPHQRVGHGGDIWQ